MKRIALAIATLLLAGSALGQPASADEPLGRLFFTPQQRATLDAGVPVSRPAPRSAAAAPVRRPAPKPIPQELRLGGVVTRSDGERTVWIDGKPYHGGDAGEVRVITDIADPGGARIQTRGSQTPIEVRVGQTLDPRTGTVREPYAPAERGRN
ncbi:MAG TPA: hypothetical protein VMP00_04835 [Burkholderiales bacterium]|nr:hypothetical protein [Burkholderiales bacterium]